MSDVTIISYDNEVQNLGEELEVIWWQGKQWSVTEYGLECRDGCYHLAANQLTDNWDGSPDLPRHMGGKEWCDIDDFCTAFTIALVLHGYGDVFTPDQIRKSYKKGKIERELEKEFLAQFPISGEINA